MTFGHKLYVKCIDIIRRSAFVIYARIFVEEIVAERDDCCSIKSNYIFHVPPLVPERKRFVKLILIKRLDYYKKHKLRR